ncbi:hypothetical protein V8E54_001436 [Elaphomyces granulatus]
MPPALTQSQREQITAALFRQEPYPQICSAYNVSDRQLRRIAHCLRTFGTTAPPKKESTKPMGRPRKMNDEMLEELRQYVEQHPLAGLKELQAHIEGKFSVACGRPSISRRLKEMGYTLSIVSRGATSIEKENLPQLSHEDTQRLTLDPTAEGTMSAGSGSVYAWLKTSKPVPRRTGPREKKRRTASEEPIQSEDEADETPEREIETPTQAPSGQQPSAHGSLEESQGPSTAQPSPIPTISANSSSWLSAMVSPSALQAYRVSGMGVPMQRF